MLSYTPPSSMLHGVGEKNLFGTMFEPDTHKMGRGSNSLELVLYEAANEPE